MCINVLQYKTTLHESSRVKNSFHTHHIDAAKTSSSRYPWFSSPTLALRQKNRTTNSAKKRAEADRLKMRCGNDMFKDTNYVGASRRYIQATKLVGHTPVLMSNLAAAHLKLEQWVIYYENRSISLMKARYRRGVARGKQAEFEAAHAGGF
ncbi:hypothetical protein BD779DRAFT_1547352 [Infundibulicybe gibba]|nr:hypothetical protein BD779DRAFT_1547352 [Infundibulicybe gibba]